jgi:hypothetical protein
VVDGLGQTELEDLRLEAAVEEVLNLESEDVVELHLVLLEDAVAHKAAEQRIAFEQTLGVLHGAQEGQTTTSHVSATTQAAQLTRTTNLLVEGEELTGGLADLGERVLDAPDLGLVLKTVLSNELELLVETLLFAQSTRVTERYETTSNAIGIYTKTTKRANLLEGTTGVEGSLREDLRNWTHCREIKTRSITIASL